MKDPLHLGETAYDVLGLDRTADEAAVEKAFKMGVIKRLDPNKLTTARNDLRSPADRAMLDLFLYDPDAVEDLSPSPAEDVSALHAGNRAATATSWERTLKQSFPDYSLIHSLAVLWYWWTLNEEDKLHQLILATGGKVTSFESPSLKRELLRQVRRAEGADCNPDSRHDCAHTDCPWKEHCSSSAPPIEKMWTKVVAYWAAVLSSPEFLDGGRGLSDADRDTLRKEIDSRVKGLLHDLSQRYQGNGGAQLSEMYQKLELQWTTELKTARDISDSGMRTSSGKIHCGTMLLRQLGLLDSTKRQLDDLLAKNPTNERLASIRRALSSHSSIAMLLDAKQYEAVIQAVSALPDNERRAREVIEMMASALFGLGRQQISLGRPLDALRNWAQAIKHCQGSETERKIRDEAVSLCRTKGASNAQGAQRDEIIELLEQGLKIVNDETVRMQLAELIAQKGIDQFLDAQREADDRGYVTTETIKEYEAGIAIIEKAAKMGSKRGQDQAEITKSLLKDARSEILDGLSPDAAALVKKSRDAWRRDDRNSAIDALRSALPLVSGQTLKALKCKLSFYLANHGIDKINQAMDIVRIAREEYNRQIDLFFAEIQVRTSFSVLGACCQHCGKGKYGSYGDWYTVNMPDGSSVELCEQCANEFNNLVRNRPSPNAEAVRLFQGGYWDIMEATELDPKNDHASKSKSEAASILSDYGVGVGTRPKPITKSAPKPSPKPSSGGQRVSTKSKARTPRSGEKKSIPLVIPWRKPRVAIALTIAGFLFWASMWSSEIAIWVLNALVPLKLDRVWLMGMKISRIMLMVGIVWLIISYIGNRRSNRQ